MGGIIIIVITNNFVMILMVWKSINISTFIERIIVINIMFIKTLIMIKFKNILMIRKSIKTVIKNPNSGYWGVLRVALNCPLCRGTPVSHTADLFYPVFHSPAWGGAPPRTPRTPPLPPPRCRRTPPPPALPTCSLRTKKWVSWYNIFKFN